MFDLKKKLKNAIAGNNGKKDTSEISTVNTPTLTRYNEPAVDGLELRPGEERVAIGGGDGDISLVNGNCEGGTVYLIVDAVRYEQLMQELLVKEKTQMQGKHEGMRWHPVQFLNEILANRAGIVRIMEFYNRGYMGNQYKDPGYRESNQFTLGQDSPNVYASVIYFNHDGGVGRILRHKKGKLLEDIRNNVTVYKANYDYHMVLTDPPTGEPAQQFFDPVSGKMTYMRRYKNAQLVKEMAVNQAPAAPVPTTTL